MEISSKKTYFAFRFFQVVLLLVAVACISVFSVSCFISLAVMDVRYQLPADAVVFSDMFLPISVFVFFMVVFLLFFLHVVFSNLTHVKLRDHKDVLLNGETLDLSEDLKVVELRIVGWSIGWLRSKNKQWFFLPRESYKFGILPMSYHRAPINRYIKLVDEKTKQEKNKKNVGKKGTEGLKDEQ